MSVAPPALSPDASSSSANLASEKAALAKLLATYTSDLQRGQTPAQLQSLGKQIVAVAKALGQNVTLPQPSVSNTSSATAPVFSPPKGDKMPPGYA